MEKLNLTAKEARELANDGKKLMNRLYKFIREEASDGKEVVRFICQDTSESVLKKIESSLVENGYKGSIYRSYHKYSYSEGLFTDKPYKDVLIEIS